MKKYLMSALLMVVLISYFPAIGADDAVLESGGAEYCCVTPGDANDDGSTNIADATFIIWQTVWFIPDFPCYNQADANGDGSINIADAAYIVRYIFFNGNAPICPEEF